MLLQIYSYYLDRKISTAVGQVPELKTPRQNGVGKKKSGYREGRCKYEFYD